jgi:hypothetical protein
MKIEVPITKFSEEYIIATLGQYKEISELEPISGRCIIHMYPKHDTVKDDNGDDLRGYLDAMNCDLHIYDVNKMTVYKTEYHDAISLYDTNLSIMVKVFKDLSTMIILDIRDKTKKIKFGNFQAFDVYCD